MKYILPVIAISIVFNIPKFFEAQVKVDPDDPDEPFIDVTELRTNPGDANFLSPTPTLMAFTEVANAYGWLLRIFLWFHLTWSSDKMVVEKDFMTVSGNVGN